ncbi:MAG: cobalt transporter CbiM [Rhodopirellula sp.]|nr:cobalt transporter CbiM [Rhodopirellula sp.]
MHITEGLLSTSTEGMLVLGAGAVVAAAGTAIGLRKLDYERVPQVAMLSAAFFVASLIHVPLGFTSVHLVLNGLVGLVLGWAAFPALLIALLLQAVLLGFGGPTTLGINTTAMALPAVACYGLFHRFAVGRNDGIAALSGLCAGALAIVLGAMIVALALLGAGEQFAAVWKLVILAQLPIAAIEGLITSTVLVFLRKVRPELLQSPLLLADRLEVGDA